MRIVAIILITLLVSCSREIEIPVSFPVVITDDVEVIEGTGARFSAHVAYKSADPIVKHGFVWGFSKDLSLNSYNIVIEGDPSESFSRSITRDLPGGDVVYNVRAFVQTSTNTVFGNAVAFKSKGSKPPKFVGVSPQQGFDGTEITLTLSNFIFSEGVSFKMAGIVDLAIVSATDSTVKVTLPPNNLIGAQTITAISSRYNANSIPRFTILGPIITTLPKETASPGEEMIIAGEYLDMADDLAVVFEDHTGPELPMAFEVLSSTEIKVTIPDPTGDQGRVRLTATVGNTTKTSRATKVLVIE